MTFTESVRQVLEILASGDRMSGAQLHVEARSVNGIGSDGFTVRVADDVQVPLRALELLAAPPHGYALTAPAAVMLTDAVSFASAGALVACWKIGATFVAGDRRWVASPEDAERVTAAIAAAPRPSCTVIAGQAIWAAWRLEQPLRSQQRYIAALRALARRLGSDDPGAKVPRVQLAGPVRNWNNDPPDFTQIVNADAQLRYQLAALLPEEGEAHVA